jgi:hypothetical protein
MDSRVSLFFDEIRSIHIRFVLVFACKSQPVNIFGVRITHCSSRCHTVRLMLPAFYYKIGQLLKIRLVYNIHRQRSFQSNKLRVYQKISPGSMIPLEVSLIEARTGPGAAIPVNPHVFSNKKYALYI